MTAVQNFSLPTSRIRDFLIVVGASLLLALSSLISIRLPFSPIPISLTAQLVLLLSLTLGKRGAYATTLYFAQGAMGLPFFANGGGGIAYLIGPTGGYLLGFVVAAHVVAHFAEKTKGKTPLRTFSLLLLGNSLIYLFGLPHLATLIGWEKALYLGLVPFIGTDLIKLAIAQRAANRSA